MRNLVEEAGRNLDEREKLNVLAREIDSTAVDLLEKYGERHHRRFDPLKGIVSKLLFSLIAKRRGLNYVDLLDCQKLEVKIDTRERLTRSTKTTLVSTSAVPSKSEMIAMGVEGWEESLIIIRMNNENPKMILSKTPWQERFLGDFWSPGAIRGDGNGRPATLEDVTLWQGALNLLKDQLSTSNPPKQS